LQPVASDTISLPLICIFHSFHRIKVSIICPDLPFFFRRKEWKGIFGEFPVIWWRGVCFLVNVTEKGEREKGTRHVSTPLALASDKNKSVIPEMTDGR
jgi:hypothetical protein